MENTELTTAQAELTKAENAYDVQVQIPTAHMTAAEKKSHLDRCIDLLEKKRAARRHVDGLLRSKQDLRDKM